MFGDVFVRPNVAGSLPIETAVLHTEGEFSRLSWADSYSHGMNHATKMDNDSKQWLIIIVAVIAGSTQAYGVITGNEGSLAILAVIGWVLVIIISGWQLRRSPN